MLVLGVAPIQVQHLALNLVELNEIPMGSLSELVQVPLDGIQSFRSATHFAYLLLVYLICLCR